MCVLAQRFQRVWCAIRVTPIPANSALLGNQRQPSIRHNQFVSLLQVLCSALLFPLGLAAMHTVPMFAVVLALLSPTPTNIISFLFPTTDTRGRPTAASCPFSLGDSRGPPVCTTIHCCVQIMLSNPIILRSHFLTIHIDRGTQTPHSSHLQDACCLGRPTRARHCKPRKALQLPVDILSIKLWLQLWGGCGWQHITLGYLVLVHWLGPLAHHKQLSTAAAIVPQPIDDGRYANATSVCDNLMPKTS